MAKDQAKDKLYRQYAALPYCERDGELLVVLVTSRETQRWIVPKGWAEPNLKGYEVAAQEAMEEAGLIGEVARKPLGSFRYVKRLEAEARRLCKVEVYPLRITEVLEDWPEKSQRRREWMTPSQAAMLVGEAGLIQMLLDLTDYGETAETALSRRISRPR